MRLPQQPTPLVYPPPFGLAHRLSLHTTNPWRTGTATAWLRSGVAYQAPASPLYHVMGLQKARSVIQTDAMPARWLHVIPSLGAVFGNSFSRNPLFDRFNGVLRLVADQDRLRRHHRVMPLDAERVFNHQFQYPTERGDRDINRSMGYAEEFVLGDITPVSSYVCAVSLHHLETLSGAEAQEAYRLARAYTQRHRLAFAVSRSSIQCLRRLHMMSVWERLEDHEEAY